MVKEEVPDARYILGGVHPDASCGRTCWRRRGFSGRLHRPRRGRDGRSEQLFRALTTGGDPTAIRRPRLARRRRQPPKRAVCVPSWTDLEEYPADFDGRRLVDLSLFRHPQGAPRGGGDEPWLQLRHAISARNSSSGDTRGAAVIRRWSRKRSGCLHDEYGVNVVLFTDEYPTPDAGAAGRSSSTASSPSNATSTCSWRRGRRTSCATAISFISTARPGSFTSTSVSKRPIRRPSTGSTNKLPSRKDASRCGWFASSGC